MEDGKAKTTVKMERRRSRSIVSPRKKHPALNLRSRNLGLSTSMHNGRSLSTSRHKETLRGNMDKFLGLGDDDDDDDFFSNMDAALGPKKETTSKKNKSKFVGNPSTANTPYKTLQQTFNGAIEYKTLNSDQVKGKQISNAIEEFQKRPEKYLCLYYYGWMRSYPLEDQQYTLILREGTQRLKVPFDPKSDRTIWIHTTGTAGVTDDGYQQILEEEQQQQQPQEEPSKKKTPTLQRSSSPPTPKESYRKPETREERQVKQTAAREKGTIARNRRLKLDEKRCLQAFERAAANPHTSGGGTRIKRIPKRSAILAVGGPEAEEYNAMMKEEKLAQWQSKAGEEWEILCDHTFDAVSTSETLEEEAVWFDSVEEAIEDFMEDPDKYMAMYFPVHAIKKPNGKKVEVTHVLRAGTTNYKPLGVRNGDGGQYALFQHIYHRLDPLEEDLLPKRFRDNFTNDLTFKDKKLHSKKKQKRKPLLPGRGMGLGDSPTMTFLGDCAEPNDIFQGTSVGNCWLLSAIACLADFDFAIRRLFRKTPAPKLEDRPQNAPNQYIVTLWDVTTWQEVDIVVDEQLPVRSDNTGFLLGARPSKEGKIWVPYLEKAIAYHCGGYEKLIGGNCANAWPMLTGSRNQFIIMKNGTTEKYKCTARFDTSKQEWTPHANSPRDGDRTTWDVEWPKAGGGGERGVEMSQEALFQKIVVWDASNYLIGAGTSGLSDRNSTDGLVDNHAYSIIDSRMNICETGIDLLLIRNPWGEGGELKSAKFARNGPGWKSYPDIQSELNPSTEDNGMCWITREEFFQHFPTIYLSAFDTARLKEDDYVNDLTDDFPRDAANNPARVEDEKVAERSDDAADLSSSEIGMDIPDTPDQDDNIHPSTSTTPVIPVPVDEEGNTEETTTVTKESSTTTGEMDKSEHVNDVSPSNSSNQEEVEEDLVQNDEEKANTEETNDDAGTNERAQRESIRGYANQVELMKQKMEEERNKKNADKGTGAKRGPAPKEGMSKVELMTMKFQGGK